MSRVRLRERLVTAGLRLAFRGLPRLPARPCFALFDLAARVMYRLGGASVARLRVNYAQARPELSPAELEALVEAGVRSYLRYWCEAFRQPALSDGQLRASVRVIGDEPYRQALSRGEPVVCFLAHMGNWDLAGAWSQIELARTVTVAERLKPEPVFEEFVRMRQRRGVTIYPLTGEHDVLRQLMADTRSASMIPLLADRDLTSGGVQVDFLGGRAPMAVGPAVLAMRSTGYVVPVSLHYERAGRAVTPSGYRTVITFLPPVADPGRGRSRDRVTAMTQACADALGEAIREHTEDWHMMQPVFAARPGAGNDGGHAGTGSRPGDRRQEAR